MSLENNFGTNMSYFEINASARAEILKFFNRNEESLKEDVTKLRDWLQAQKHLPEIPDDKLIENFLLINKCRTERAKEKLDMYYTIRGLIPEMFENVNPKTPHMQEILDLVQWVPLPKTTRDFYRVNCLKIVTTEPQKINVFHFFAHTYNIAEIRLREDLCFGDILIYDLSGMNLGLLTKLTPSVIAKTNAVLDKVYSSRLKGIHFVNSPNFVQNIVTMLKSLLKPKLTERIHVHKSMESLREFFPEEVLPSDFGGKEKSLSELNGLLREKLSEYQPRFDLLDRMKVDESLRPEKLENDELLGFHGNFKKLSVD